MNLRDSYSVKTKASSNAFYVYAARPPRHADGIGVRARGKFTVFLIKGHRFPLKFLPPLLPFYLFFSFTCLCLCLWPIQNRSLIDIVPPVLNPQDIVPFRGNQASAESWAFPIPMRHKLIHPLTRWDKIKSLSLQQPCKDNERGQIMARPIKETPILFGEDARPFQEEMGNVKPASCYAIKEGGPYMLSALFAWCSCLVSCAYFR